MRTGTLTSPKLIEPLQIALGIASLCPAPGQEKRTRPVTGKAVAARAYLLVRLLMLALALVTVLGLSASQATGAKTRSAGDTCTWGTSSTRVTVLEGRVVPRRAGSDRLHFALTRAGPLAKPSRSESRCRETTTPGRR